MSDAPILVRYDGEAFVPASQFWAKRADKQYVVGEIYPMVAHQERSMNAHKRFFAGLNEAWKNLPDELRDEYPTVEHLRKKALCRKGYADERSIVCASKAEALRVAAFIKPMDDYAVVTVRDNCVRVYTAKSQSVRAMGKDEFYRSADDVADFAANLIGVARGDLEQNARQAA